MLEPRKSRRGAAKRGALVRVFDEGRKMRVAVSILLSLAAFPSAPLAAQRVQTGFLDRSVTLSGVAYRYQVYVPANYSATQRWPVILFLHAEAIRSAGGDVKYTEFLGMEHNVWDAVYASPQFLEWLFAQRRRR